MNVKEYLKENRLLFDGSMGTYFTSLHPYCKENVELVSLTHPNWIKEIHEAMRSKQIHSAAIELIFQMKPYYRIVYRLPMI